MLAINTYWPLDVGEATKQEKKMEHGAQAGGAGGQRTWMKTLCIMFSLPLHPRNTPCISSSGVVSFNIISRGASAWDEDTTAHDHTSMPTMALLYIVPLSQDKSHQVTDTQFHFWRLVLAANNKFFYITLSMHTTTDQICQASDPSSVPGTCHRLVRGWNTSIVNHSNLLSIKDCTADMKQGIQQMIHKDPVLKIQSNANPSFNPFQPRVQLEKGSQSVFSTRGWVRVWIFCSCAWTELERSLRFIQHNPSKSSHPCPRAGSKKSIAARFCSEACLMLSTSLNKSDIAVLLWHWPTKLWDYFLYP